MSDVNVFQKSGKLNWPAEPVFVTTALAKAFSTTTWVSQPLASAVCSVTAVSLTS